MNSLRLKLVLGGVGGVALVLLLALSLGYGALREQALDQGAAQLQRQQLRLVAGLDQVFARAEQRAHELAHQVNRVGLSDAQLIELMTGKLLNDGEVVQLGVLLEPVNPVRAEGRFAVSVTYGASGVQVTDFVATGYQYWTKDWYQRTLASKQGWWADPYFNDAAGGQDTLTFDRPLLDPEGRRIGMASISVAVERLAEIAESLGWRRDGGLSEYLLIDAQGKILLAADPAIELAYRLDDAVDRGDSELAAWMQQTGGDTTVEVQRSTVPGGQVMVQAQMPRLGWRAGSAVSEATLLRALHSALLQAALLAGLLCALLVWLADRMGRRLTQPLQALTLAGERLAEGEVQFEPAVVAMPELRRLGAALERARQTLAGNLGRARAASDARQRSEGQELLASELQRDVLPADRIFFGSQLQAQLSGRLDSQRALGGAFYGFVSAAPGVCVFYLGEAEPAGVGAVALRGRLAALLPAVIRHVALPSEVIEQVAEQLIQLDSAEWSVKLLVVRLELGAGLLHVASAGHPLPLLFDGSQQRQLSLTPGPALSREASPGWSNHAETLAAGQRLLGFSPDWLQARGRRSDGFGLQRLQVALERHAEGAPRDLAQGLFDDLQRHTGGLAEGEFGIVIASIADRD